LETALKTFAALKGPEKWKKIAYNVEGKTPLECEDRFKVCKEIALKKKQKKN
jgi:hypothetical protein